MDKVMKGVSALLRNANVRFQISIYMGPEKLLDYTTRTPKTNAHTYFQASSVIVNFSSGSAHKVQDKYLLSSSRHGFGG
jgi:hypothetical protein